MLLNKRHVALRESLGKSGVIVDQSMMAVQEADSSSGGEEEGGDRNLIGDKAFADVTDLKNEDFIFVY